MPSPLLPPIGFDLTQWGIQLSSFLQANLAKLGYKTSDDNPSADGVILWDPEIKTVVVSLDNAFRQVATKQAVPAANTGSAGDVVGMVTWDTNYIYVATGSHDGSTAIWKRIALSSW